MSKIILFVATILAIMINTQALAQYTISGKISTSENEILTGANVVIVNTTRGTATDNNGFFQLKNVKNGNYILRVSFFGYETIEKPVELRGSDVTLNLTMEATSIDLNTVVVTATRTEKNLLNTPILTQSIGIQELQKKDATNVMEALEYTVPGIEFSSQAQGKSMSLQGIDAQYMLVLVDGEKLTGDTYGDIDYSRINIADVGQIEVVKGASSTLYGSSALGGVINIISRTPVKKLEVNASSRFSDYNTQNYQFRAGSKLGKITNQISMVYDKTDGYDLIEGDSYRTQEKEDGFTLNEHLKYTPVDNLMFEANIAYLDKDRENSSPVLFDRKNKDFTYNGKGTWFINPKNNISLSWNSDNYKLYDKVKPDSLVSVYDNLYNTARLLGTFQLANWNTLIVGSEYETENLTAPRNKIENKDNTDITAYVQEDIRIGENANILGGVRSIHNSQYGWHFTPQISGMYKIWHVAFRGNYSLGYKTPSLKEKYMTFKIPAPGPPMYLVGNENLEPETSKFASLSAEYTRKGVSFSVSAYRNNISNMISENLDDYTVKPGGIIEYTYRNYDHVLVRGIDIMLKTKIFNNLLFTGATTFSKKHNEVTDKDFESTRNFTGKANLDYSFIRKNYNLDLNLQSNFYGGKTINLMDEKTHNITPVELESFSLWRLTTTQTLWTNYFIKLGIDNIFDYVDPEGGYNTGTPGRTYFASLGINF